MMITYPASDLRGRSSVSLTGRFLSLCQISRAREIVGEQFGNFHNPTASFVTEEGKQGPTKRTSKESRFSFADLSLKVG